MVTSHPHPRVLSFRAPIFGEMAAEAIDAATASQQLALQIALSFAASAKTPPKPPQPKRRASFAATTVFSAAAAAAAAAAAYDAATAAPLPPFLADVRKELPSVGQVLVALQSISENVKSATSNREELMALRDRCTYLTACVIVKCRCSTDKVDVSPLVDRANEMADLVRRCCARGRVGMAMRGGWDRRDVAELHDRLSDLTMCMGLAGIVAVEERVDDLKELLSTMKQKRQALPDVTPNNNSKSSSLSSNKKRSSVPKGTPARQCWHVTRERVVKRVVSIVIDGIRGRDGAGGGGGHGGGRRIVGLVGESGSGKTTAASEFVRSSVVRELFSDGIIWLNVGDGAKGRLRCLMHDLASMVHEVVAGGKGKPPPADSSSCDGYSSAAYIKEMRTTATAAAATKGQGHRRCLLVADDVWDAEVISELRATGMWVLVTTRREDLIRGAKGETVRLDKLSENDAEAVLRGAAGIPAGVRLPEAARDLSELCGYVAMDLAFVGRWYTVCGREDRLAWSDAAASIRMELDAQDYDDAVTTSASNKCKAEGGGAPMMKLRAAVLRAGFDELGAEGHLVQWLYMALAVMPDAHAFSVMDAAALLYDRECEMADVEVTKRIVDTLERWSILRGEGSPSAVSDMTRGWWRSQKYRMHAAHCTFARENLVDRVDVLGPTVRRWVRHISSPEAVHEISPIALVELWRAVKRVAGGGGDGCRVVDIGPSGGSYRTSGGEQTVVSAEAIESHGGREFQQQQQQKIVARGQQHEDRNRSSNNNICSLAVQCALRATQFHLDRKDWDCAFAMWARALEWMHTEEKGDTSRAIATPRGAAGAAALPSTSSAAELVFEKLVELGWCAWEAGREEEAVELVKRGAAMGEAKLGSELVDDVLMAKGEESEGDKENLLRRVLEVRVAKQPPSPVPGPDAQTVSTTLYQLACGVWDIGRCEEGISLLRRALEMVESKLSGTPAMGGGPEKGKGDSRDNSSSTVQMREQLDRWVQEAEGTE